jgi:uncharacterized coiled-coil protein SlyX
VIRFCRVQKSEPNRKEHKIVPKKLLKIVLLFSLSALAAAAQDSSAVFLKTAREALSAFQELRLQQLKRALVEAKFEQSFAQERGAALPFQSESDGEAMRNQPADREDPEVWRNRIDNQLAELKKLKSLNSRVTELTQELQQLEKSMKALAAASSATTTTQK